MDPPNAALPNAPPIDRTVTVDPLALAQAAFPLAIAEVLDCDTGIYASTRGLIEGLRYEQIVVLRGKVRERLHRFPRFRCATCSMPSYLVASVQKRFFFRHLGEDGSCPARTRGHLSQDQIKARKYHGLRESKPHLMMKGLVAQSLSADSRYSCVEIEKTWRSASDPAALRRPDVQAVGPMGPIAIEVQLSTTFLDVVVERRSFYRSENASLVWVMQGFDPGHRRMTTDDILYSNNSNFLVVDESSAALSERTGRFHVICHFRKPRREGREIVDDWDRIAVPFDDLTFDRDGQRAFLLDYDGEAEAIRSAIDSEDRRHEAALRSDLFAFWSTRAPHVELDPVAARTWQVLRDAYAQHGVLLPANPESDGDFVALVNAVASAKAGAPVGWRFRRLVEVGHRLAEGYPQLIVLFGHALRSFGRKELVASQDHSALWAKKTAPIRESIASGEQKFIPPAWAISLACFLLPDARDKISRLAARATHEQDAPRSRLHTI